MGSKPRVVVENLFLLPLTWGNQGNVTNILRFNCLPVVEVTALLSYSQTAAQMNIIMARLYATTYFQLT
jgi:hypothetical protein